MNSSKIVIPLSLLLVAKKVVIKDIYVNSEMTKEICKEEYFSIRQQHPEWKSYMNNKNIICFVEELSKLCGNNIKIGRLRDLKPKSIKQLDKSKQANIYSLVCKNTKKEYIGKTQKPIHERLKKHFSAARWYVKNNKKLTALMAAIVENPNIEDWDISLITISESDEKACLDEKKYIALKNTLYPTGYNTTLGGTGGDTNYGENVSCRKERSKQLSHFENNPRYCGYSDQQILDHYVKFYNGVSIPKAAKIEAKINNIPIMFSKNRFVKFGGGFRGFMTALNNLYIEIKK